MKVGDSLSRSVEVLSGVPQGSVLDSFLFIVYIADLGNVITSPFPMYADDIKLYNKSSNKLQSVYHTEERESTIFWHSGGIHRSPYLASH